MREERCQEQEEVADHAIIRGQVDELATARPLPFMQRRQDRGRAIQRGTVMRERRTGAGRRIAGKSGARHHPAQRLQGQVARRRVAQDAGPPERGDRAEDSARRTRHQRLERSRLGERRIEPELVDQDDVGAADQRRKPAPRRLRPPRLRHFVIEDDAALLRRGELECETVTALAEWPGLPQPIARRRLDLDDVGAEFRQEAAGERSGPALRQFDHPQSGECSCHRRSSPGYAPNNSRAIASCWIWLVPAKT